MQNIIILGLVTALCGLIGAYFGLKGAQKIAVWYMLKRAEQQKSVVQRYKNTISKKLLETMINALPPAVQIPISLALKSDQGKDLLKYCTKNEKSTLATLEIALHLAMKFGGQKAFDNISPEHQDIAEQIITKR